MATPKQDGFRMPGEFEHHDRTFMTFPHRPDNWRNNAKNAQHAIADLAREISKHEEVVMITPREHMYTAVSLLHDTNVKITAFDSDDCWTRDTGATFVSNGNELRGISWDFNAWGGHYDGCYTSWDKDSKIAGRMCAVANASVYRTEGFVLEGGSVHVDGDGTCITTEECLLSGGRNPHLSKGDIEHMLKEHLNVDKVLWLKHGVIDDETNGHVDNMACFARPGEVILAWTDDTTHPQYERSKEAYEYLSSQTDAKGRPLKIYKLHIPNDMYVTQEESDGIVRSGHALPRNVGDRLAASYVNFVMPNGAIIFPTFGDDEYDARALETLKSIFPEREVTGLYSREILLGGGNLHCVTQQQPSVY
ncbi:agmatine deiminase [Acanthocystis turfacea Chlorella virus MO0605SPH]|nr:agmatine deiminase [Acanthocystis turfacea Chlorella virus MO0605SPH]AGE57132.1 agmatine deiminase [Acanthocystis turfacea Chlorella virus NE-JV-3]AGE60250.1 agmatine deiminase [Acanthocystis turfacea Chlorella virus WI0606]